MLTSTSFLPSILTWIQLKLLTTPCTPIGVVHLGLIGQFHYQAIQVCYATSTSSDNQKLDQSEWSDEEQDQEFIEDQETLTLTLSY